MRLLSTLLAGLALAACTGSPPATPPPAAPPAAALPPTTGPVRPAPGSPSEPVQQAYDREEAHQWDEPTWLATASKDLAARYLAADALAKGCGVLPMNEGDFVADAQDVQITELRLTERVDGDKATVTAQFLNFGEPRTVTYDVVREDGAWRIDDVHPRGMGLRASIAASVTEADGC